MNLFGQDLEQHLWNNRILILKVDRKNSEILKDQLDILAHQNDELKERKLIIYKVTEDEYSKNFNENWIPKNDNFIEDKNQSKTFEVILVGLDGGIKFRQDTIISNKKLFSIIDGMSMRIREINSNKN